MANASPSSTPNPDAMTFTLDTTLPEMFNVANADDAAGNQFAEAVFAAGGVVASIFGVNDFVTITRQPGSEWDPTGPGVSGVNHASAEFGVVAADREGRDVGPHVVIPWRAGREVLSRWEGARALADGRAQVSLDPAADDPGVGRGQLVVRVPGDR